MLCHCCLYMLVLVLSQMSNKHASSNPSLKAATRSSLLAIGKFDWRFGGLQELFQPVPQLTITGRFITSRSPAASLSGFSESACHHCHHLFCSFPLFTTGSQKPHNSFFSVTPANTLISRVTPAPKNIAETRAVLP